MASKGVLSEREGRKAGGIKKENWYRMHKGKRKNSTSRNEGTEARDTV